MGKIIRRVIAILLTATAVMLAVIPADTAEATSTHGDYEYDGATVAKYLGSDSEVTLPAWVNRVGKEAFEGYDRMTKLVIPDAVTTVDFGAFSNCRNLETVKMSESVRTIGSSAFSGCSNLYSVSVPRTVRTIGSGAFAGCPSLSNVPISPLNENYTSYDSVIYSADGKKLVQYLAGRPYTTYQMPRSVREIEEYAFWGANNLSKLSITNGVKAIPEYAFSNCKGLQHVTLPRSVQSIFAYAFEDCDSLSYINIPDSVGYIDDRAFANTRGAKLRFLDANGNVVKTFNSEDVDSYGNGTGGGAGSMVTGPDYAAKAEEIAAAENASAPNSSATATGTDVSENPASDGTTAGNEGSANGGSANGGSNSTAADSNGSTTYYDDGTQTGTNAGAFDPTLVTPLDEGDVADTGTQTAVPAGSEAANSQTVAAGGANTNANTDTSGNGLYNDGYYKASDSGTPPWETKIQYRNYENNLTDSDLGAGVVLGGSTVLRMSSDIPVRGFDFDNAEYEDDYGDLAGQVQTPKQSENDIIGDVYAAYNGEEPAVNVPNGVSRVGDRAFYRKGNLQSVNLPSGIEEIGEFAFARSALSDINIPDGTKTIDYAAFYNCPNLSAINIPQSVERVALGAFDGTPFLENWKENGEGDYFVVGDGVLLSYKGKDKKITVPENVKHIGAGAFAGKNNLETVVIPGSVEDIGEEAFSDCSGLKELVLGEGVRNIEDRAFKNSDLKVVSIPDSVETVGLSAFDNGGKLESVIITGENVPNVSYNKSATRLSAKNLRTDAFEGAENAIVSGKCNLDDGTLFNPRFYGFSGEVYSIASNDDKTLCLERVLAKPDTAGNIMINQNVDIAGNRYTINQVKNDAFDMYRNWNDYFDYRPSNVIVNGEQSSELETLLSSVNSDILSQTREEDVTYSEDQPEDVQTAEDIHAENEPGQDQPSDNPIRSNITVAVNGSRFPTRGDAYANIPGETDKYTLSINEDDSVKDQIEKAFIQSTGSTPGGDMVPLSVDLFDKSGTVPIHKLGNSKMEVTMPLPKGMENDEGIGVACLDDNGKLTTLSSEITDEENGKNVKFVTGHCSPYVIYSRGHSRAITSFDADGNPIETIDDVGAAGPAFDMSGTWQSMNKKVIGPISPKWFIIFILLALAGILVLYKPAKKKADRSKEG
ncbi:MAG: leucine-rich repeat protein [Lachnospiraceae bacterium]|nr:leucine-rich repeat protein [Lachnospiraceae bacterium]